MKPEANREGFPADFKVQRIGVTLTNALSDLPAAQIATHFRQHPELAQALLNESQNKRFTPSTFIAEKDCRFVVGWFTSKAQYQCLQEFSELADAATDYVLFSSGKGRWKEPGM